MPDPALAVYQTRMTNLLQQIYTNVDVQEEWRSVFGEGKYSPRIDIAVGPFSTEHGVQLIDEYDQLMNRTADFIARLAILHLANIGVTEDRNMRLQSLMERLWSRNRNARCLLAIEIENEVSEKHLMGGAINAAALGRVGIALAWKPQNLSAFIHMKQYLDYLKEVHKNTFDTANLLILDKDQLHQAIQEYLDSN